MSYRISRRSRSRSPNVRSRSKSPKEWKRPEQRGGGGGDRASKKDGVVRLYVSNLPYEIRWQELKDLFKDQVGNDVSFVQLYDEPNGKPSGAGAVEIKSADSANKAIELFDRFEFKGRKIIVREERERDRIRHIKEDRPDHSSSRNESSRHMSSGGGNSQVSSSRGFTIEVLSQLGIEVGQITSQVFVANLDYKVTKSKLEEIFRMAGNVIDAEIKVDKEGKSRGMGVVRFEHPIEAVQAISLFTNQYLYDRQLFVRMDKWVDPIMQDIPSRLPSGLKGIGIGMAANGRPLLNIGEIANTLTLSYLTGQLGGSNISTAASNSLGMPGLNMNSTASLLSSFPSLLGGAAGMGGAGGYGSSLSGQLLAQQASSSGLAPNMQQAAQALLNTLGMSMGGINSVDNGNGDLSQYGGGGNMHSSSSAYNMISQSGYDNRDRSYERQSYDRQSYDRVESSRNAENSAVFVKNLPFNFSTQNMYDKFRDFGDIKYADVKTDGTGKSRGCGIVQFYDSESARKAICQMNGSRIDGRSIEVRLDRMG